MSEGELILAAGALLAAGLLASLVAGRLRIPGLVLFLAVGMIVGSDVTGLIEFDDYELARDIGVVALALILFEGGLAAGLPEIRPVLGVAISLATLGTLLTALVTGAAAWALFDFSLLEGLLLGAVVCATDGAAIFAVLRGSSLRRRLARTLEGEAGLNDPIAVLLVLGFIEWIELPDYGVVDMLVLFARQIGIGLVVGVAVGWLAVQAFQKAQLATTGLYPVASLATVALAFGGADSLHGSGFLATYLAGLALGTAAIPAKPTITAFHEGVAWVAQLSMFLVLGLLVFPAHLDEVILEGTVLALVLAVVARPLATWVATAFGGYTAAERVILGWAGLRGAVPVVLATFPVIDEVPGSLEFFNIVFFAVVLSTLLQGTTFEALAHRLGVTSDEPALPRPIVEVGTIRRLGAEVIEYEVDDGDAAVGARVRELGLPRDAIVSLLVRDEQALLPRGSTRVEAGDRLHVLVRREVARELPSLLESWREGPVGPAVRPRRRFTGTVPIYTARPWLDEDGDPAHPLEVLGRDVVEHLRTRRDMAGALVVLADGRYAVTGPLLMVGPPAQLQFQVRRRLALAVEDAERAWWQEVIGACAL
ncbi:MAG: potassium/proton antiporter [Gaiellaceae bacterium]